MLNLMHIYCKVTVKRKLSARLLEGLLDCYTCPKSLSLIRYNLLQRCSYYCDIVKYFHTIFYLCADDFSNFQWIFNGYSNFYLFGEKKGSYIYTFKHIYIYAGHFFLQYVCYNLLITIFIANISLHTFFGAEKSF